jgi:hypothetical protein
LTALRQAGAIVGEAKIYTSLDDLPKIDAKNPLYRENNLLLIGAPDDPLLQKCWGHQAKIGAGEFYRLGYGKWAGDIGFIESDWNPFLFSNATKTSDFSAVCIKISGTNEMGMLAALEAFRRGVLNGVIDAGNPVAGAVEPSILDLAPEALAGAAFAPPVLPKQITDGADFIAYNAGWTQADATEYRAYLDYGAAPQKIWRVKYLAEKAFDAVDGDSWLNWIHRLAYGNAVTIAQFANAADAEAVIAGLSAAQGKEEITLDGVKYVAFKMSDDEVFSKDRGKIYYTAKGNYVLASSLPEKLTAEIAAKFSPDGAE